MIRKLLHWALERLGPEVRFVQTGSDEAHKLMEDTNVGMTPEDADYIDRQLSRKMVYNLRGQPSRLFKSPLGEMTPQSSEQLDTLERAMLIALTLRRVEPDATPDFEIAQKASLFWYGEMEVYGG